MNYFWNVLIPEGIDSENIFLIGKSAMTER